MYGDSAGIVYMCFINILYLCVIILYLCVIILYLCIIILYLCFLVSIDLRAELVMQAWSALGNHEET